MIRKRIHLVCNAHLDPVWLWHWEDGLTEALSTYRTAADFCEGHEDFVFNHNEALLYRWALEPQLFKRIETLVRKGQWEIAGGWCATPRCGCGAPKGRDTLPAAAGRGWLRRQLARAPGSDGGPAAMGDPPFRRVLHQRQGEGAAVAEGQCAQPDLQDEDVLPEDQPTHRPGRSPGPSRWAPFSGGEGRLPASLLGRHGSQLDERQPETGGLASRHVRVATVGSRSTGPLSSGQAGRGGPTVAAAGGQVEAGSHDRGAPAQHHRTRASAHRRRSRIGLRRQRPGTSVCDRLLRRQPRDP